jgi:mitochondrial chaperone BCS1
MLFDELPDQCLVLLEDVDSAGLVVRDTNVDPAWTEDNSNSIRSSSSRISLSGLLNVIDGISAQEGRLLIMTTNNVKALDSALLRPGRIDVRIHFELATKKQAEDLFIQAFTTASNSVGKQHDNKTGVDDLNRMACAFAAEIPEKKLSPAAIQGYLMNWKKNPTDAVANVKKWLS